MMKLSGSLEEEDSMARTEMMALLLAGVTALSVGCALPQSSLRSTALEGVRGASQTPVRFLTPASVPSAVLGGLQAGAQKTADEASRRKGIDFFNLHANPVGLRIGAGAEAAYVLSFLGTSRERTDLDIEMRALLASGHTAYTYNYSGPVTRSAAREVVRTPELGMRAAGLSFELLTGLPGNGVSDAYADYLGHLGEYLERRYQARPFTFDDTPLVFALTRGDEAVGFLFTNQRNLLVLGDRKYADVQNVAFLGQDGEVQGAYTLIGFNEKTTSPTAAPAYDVEDDERFGSLVEFGDR